MILDSSAIVAVLLDEPGAEGLIETMLDAEALGVGAPTLCETGMVLTSRVGPESRGMLERFLQEFEVVEVPFGSEHWREAVEAFRRYGRGRHPAGLNFGDCLSYATARLSGRPLLFVGEDFPQTDVDIA
ncbi:MAG TPA: type II toxin-antitoxin system VapC family toxin [Thermoanaerobaculia bacterium]|nr:type II toxin-antitoxin system VapC family toxin [Thermoanaerobaculia bacterium]